MYSNRLFGVDLPIKFLNDGGIEFIGYQGLASHGGALGLIIALILYSRKTKQSIILTIDLIAVVAALGGGFFIEFVKERQVAFEANLKLDMGQILSIPYILIGIAFIIYGIRKT